MEEWYALNRDLQRRRHAENDIPKMSPPQYYSKKFSSAQKVCMMIFDIDSDLNFKFGVFEEI